MKEESKIKHILFFVFSTFLIIGFILINDVEAKKITGCRAGALDNLSVRYLKGDNQGKVALRWDKASYYGCKEDHGFNYYELQLWRINGTLVKEISNIELEKVRLNFSDLERNRAYNFRVRAISTDLHKTPWSDYKQFRTPPKRPKEILLKDKTSNSIYAYWKNVKRSKLLKYYLVALKKQPSEDVILKLKHKSNLKSKYTGIQLEDLELGKYKITVKSVYSKKLNSKFRSKKFKIE